MSIKDELLDMQEKKYRDFQVKLIPSINPNNVIGIRTPLLRKYAKELVKNNNYSSFLKELPHQYFDENQLHAFIISEIKDYDECIIYINEFLPYVDNWATCDQMSPKVFKKHHDKLIIEIKKWISSKEVYTIRFGIGMLMQHFLDEDYKVDYLEMVSKIKFNDYYVNMMIAWFFATALAKKYHDTIPIIAGHKLDAWIHNKTIQKAVESFRITPEQKVYLKRLKIK